MDSISTIYLYPLVGNTTNLPYDPTKPLKQWAMPESDVPAGTDLDGDLFLFRHAVLATDAVTVTTPQADMTYRQAITINAPPVGSTSVPSVPVTPPAPAFIPLDPAKLAALTASGGKLVGNGPLEAFEGGAAIFVQPATVGPAPVPAGTDPTEARILAGEEELLKNAGLPLV